MTNRGSQQRKRTTRGRVQVPASNIAPESAPVLPVSAEARIGCVNAAVWVLALLSFGYSETSDVCAIGTIETALRTRWEATLRALGRVLARGLTAGSDTAVDASEVVGRIIAEMDPARACACSDSPGTASGRAHPTTRRGVAPSSNSLRPFDGLDVCRHEIFHELREEPRQVGAIPLVPVAQCGRQVADADLPNAFGDTTA